MKLQSGEQFRMFIKEVPEYCYMHGWRSSTIIHNSQNWFGWFCFFVSVAFEVRLTVRVIVYIYTPSFVTNGFINYYNKNYLKRGCILVKLRVCITPCFANYVHVLVILLNIGKIHKIRCTLQLYGKVSFIFNFQGCSSTSLHFVQSEFNTTLKAVVTKN